jgi:hydroxyacylglutathione hydrolase
VNTANPSQPPKRKAPAEASTTTTKAPRRSKLAKEHNITAEEEAEIKEAFGLFAEPMDGEKEGILPIDDLRRAMVYVLALLPLPRRRLDLCFSNTSY